MRDHPDGLRLDESLTDLKKRGFRAAFEPKPEGHLRCMACGKTSDAHGFNVLARARVEGKQDPSDESLVVGLSCPACHALGTTVLAFGPRARRIDAEVLEGLNRVPPAA